MLLDRRTAEAISRCWYFGASTGNRRPCHTPEATMTRPRPENGRSTLSVSKIESTVCYPSIEVDGARRHYRGDDESPPIARSGLKNRRLS